MLCFFILSLFLAEITLRLLIGLGDPVIFDTNPLYGFRPLPNKEYHRFSGAKIKINNLGLRAEHNWGDNRNNKILFLGDSVTYGGSYIDNKELFSYLAVKDFKGFESGNIGVPGWGIGNVYGLVIESHFVPAKYYVSTFIEEDFSRGKTLMPGHPFFNKKPSLAILELWYRFCYNQSLEVFEFWEHFVSEAQREAIMRKVVGEAAGKLKEMDNFLKMQGFQHLIFISPTADQVRKSGKKDEIVKAMLEKYSIKCDYIIDEIPKYNLTEKDKKDLIYDHVHLSKNGHKLWAEIIKTRLLTIVTK